MVVGAAAVVRDNDGVDPGLGGNLGVFPGHDTLEDHLEFGQIAQPLDGIPGQRRRIDAGDPGPIDAIIHRLSLIAGGEVGVVMAGLAVARIQPAHADRLFLDPLAVAVDCHRNRDGALGLHALNMMLGNLELVGRVELRPDRPPAGGDNVLHRRGRAG